MSLPLVLMALLAAGETPAEAGRLRLSLADAVRLALESDAVRLHRLSYETAQLQVTSASSVFDPTIVSSMTGNDSTTPSMVLAENVTILNRKRGEASLRIDKRLPLGAQAALELTGSRTSTNDESIKLNPSFDSSLQLSLTQPLLRNRGGLAERGPIVAARRNADASREELTAQVAGAVERTVLGYWDAVLAVEGAALRRKSLELAESTRGKNRRMLEMGAIAPLEIHRSESDVASRTLDLMSAELEQRRRLAALKRATGLDADPKTAGLELELVDRPEVGEAWTIDRDAAIAHALAARPELHALDLRLEADQTQLRVARDAGRPALDLRASYTAAGLAGDRLDQSQKPAIVVESTRLGHALDQVFNRRFPIWQVSVNLSLPVVNRAAQAAVATAQVAQERDRLQRAELQRTIALDVRTALDEVLHARAAIDIATTLLEHSRKTLEAEQRKYELGTSELFLVLDAQGRLAQAELGLLSAKVGSQTALAHFDLVTGRLLERHGVKLASATP